MVHSTYTQPRGWRWGEQREKRPAALLGYILQQYAFYAVLRERQRVLGDAPSALLATLTDQSSEKSSFGIAVFLKVMLFRQAKHGPTPAQKKHNDIQITRWKIRFRGIRKSH